ncbi:hypothetical protein Tco_0991722 [Tanacetum coccineum]|uniref:Myb-like domain-containing protein n=1 Tax=Tanacetum coccineum TaxID=301880 RepID=A0ABQ5F019_9ASTR
MNLLTGSMTPEQFQQYQQEQQQAFFRWQQSQILNRDLDNLQQNPPSFHSESSQTLTQPQQVDSPKKGGRKKTKARRGKNVEDEPQEPVAAGRWLPVEEELLATCYVAVSEDNNVGSSNAAYKWSKRLGESGENDVNYLKRAQSIYSGSSIEWSAFSQEDAWALLRFPPEMGRTARQQRPAKKEIFTQRRATRWKYASSPIFGELMEQELRLKREAAERAFEASS